MIIMIFLRILCDLSLYMTFANSIAFIGFNGGIDSVLPVLLLSAAPAISSRFPGKAGRYLSLISVPIALIMAGSLVNLIVILPPCFYVVLMVFTEKYLEKTSSKNRFTLGLKLIFIFPLISAVSGNTDGFLIYGLPYVYGFLVGGVYLLRLERHDDAASKPRFLILNLLGLLLAVGVFTLLGSKEAMDTLVLVISTMYKWIIMPILMVAVYIVVGIAWLFQFLFSWLARTGPVEPPELSLESMSNPFLEEMESHATSPIAAYVSTAIVVAIFLLLAFFLFKWLFSSGKVMRRQITASETRIRISPSSTSNQKPRNPVFSRDPRERIRREYRKFLKLCEKRGQGFTHFDTTMEIEKKNRSYFDMGLMTKLRAVYLTARYTDKTLTNQDVDVAKETLSALTDSNPSK